MADAGAGAAGGARGAPPQRRRVRPGEIANKIKRAEVHAKQQHEKKRLQSEARRKRQRAAEELGAAAPPKQVPRTLDNTREVDDTIVAPGDAEVLGDEAEDEFAPYFAGERTPKLMVTTKVGPSSKIFELVSELLNVFPNSFYYKRGRYPLKKIQAWAGNKGFTHLLVLSERLKVPNGCVAPRRRGWAVAAGTRARERGAAAAAAVAAAAAGLLSQQPACARSSTRAHCVCEVCASGCLPACLPPATRPRRRQRRHLRTLDALDALGALSTGHAL